MKRTNRDEYLPLSMFEELTVEPSSFVYLISLPCWRKPKWKWHRFQRICNSSELKTTRPAKHVILSLRGWARHPQEQTGLGFVFAWVPVCASERASGGALQQKALSSTPVEKSKWVFFPFSVLIEEPRYVFVFFFSAGKSVRTHASVSLCGHLLVCFCLHVLYLMVRVCLIVPLWF